MKRAVIYLYTYHFLPPDMVAKYGEPKSSPLDVQERACRAYCERMGYAVIGVYHATTPPPEGITPHLRLRIAPKPMKAYYGYDSRHPYYRVKNLLAEGNADVCVEFRESGPGGSVWVDIAPDATALLGTDEYASLWEIEPPTELERHIYDLVQRIGEANGEEELRALATQLDVAAQQRNAARQVAAPVSPSTEPEVQSEPAVLCYACGAHPVRPSSAFCSAECVQVAAERFVRATSQRWCATCARWVGVGDCPHAEGIA